VFLHVKTVDDNGVTRVLSHGGILSWREPTGHRRGPSSQHSEKKTEKWYWIRMWISILKPEMTEKTPKNAWKQQPT